MLTFSHPGSRIPDPGVKKHPIPDPGSGSATLLLELLILLKYYPIVSFIRVANPIEVLYILSCLLYRSAIPVEAHIVSSIRVINPEFSGPDPVFYMIRPVLCVFAPLNQTIDQSMKINQSANQSNLKIQTFSSYCTYSLSTFSTIAISSAGIFTDWDPTFRELRWIRFAALIFTETLLYF
jgi:hypothetical protein